MLRLQLALVFGVSLLCAAAGRADDDDVSSTLIDIDSRVSKSEEIAYYGHKLDWRKHTLEELQDIRQRLEVTQLLSRLGERVNWQEHTLEDLSARNRRVWIAHVLRTEYDYPVNWKDHSFSDMETMRERIKQAWMLEDYYGERVDWTKYTLAELQGIRSQMILANNLASRGQFVNWRDVNVPQDPIREIDPRIASAITDLSGRFGISRERILAQVEYSKSFLNERQVTIDDLLLVTAASDISENTKYSISQSLGRYVINRRDGMDHTTAVTTAIPGYDAPPLYVHLVGSIKWTFHVVPYQPRVRDTSQNVKYYSFYGHVENLGTREAHIDPNSGADLRNILGLIVTIDNEDNEYTPFATDPPSSVLRPKIRESFEYKFKVPDKATFKSCMIRPLYTGGDDTEIATTEDGMEIVPIRQP